MSMQRCPATSTECMAVIGPPVRPRPFHAIGSRPVDRMRESGLIRCRAPEPVPERSLSLSQEGRQHLQDGIGEAGLKVRAGHGRPHRLAAGVKGGPDLLTATAGHVHEREDLYPLRVLGREAHPAVQPQRFEFPGVLLSRVDPLHLSRQRERVAIRGHPPVQDCVVPGVAALPASVRGRPLGHDVLEHAKDPVRRPAESQWHVPRVQPEIVHNAGLAAVPCLPLPVDRLVDIEVTGVQEGTAGVDDPAQGAGSHVVDGCLRAREKRKLAGAPHE